jgi:hypothetical protein
VGERDGAKREFEAKKAQLKYRMVCDQSAAVVVARAEIKHLGPADDSNAKQVVAFWLSREKGRTRGVGRPPRHNPRRVGPIVGARTSP